MAKSACVGSECVSNSDSMGDMYEGRQNRSCDDSLVCKEHLNHPYRGRTKQKLPHESGRGAHLSVARKEHSAQPVTRRDGADALLRSQVPDLGVVVRSGEE